MFCKVTDIQFFLIQIKIDSELNLILQIFCIVLNSSACIFCVISHKCRDIVPQKKIVYTVYMFENMIIYVMNEWV